MTDARKKVLVVDDSVSVGRFIGKVLASEPSLEMVGHALDAYQAREMIKALNPDVLTLDVEMPGMNGLVFLENLMRLRPMPVVMVSSLTREGAAVTLDALALGAVDFCVKRQPESAADQEAYMRDIATRVRQAAYASTRPGVGAHVVEAALSSAECDALDHARKRFAQGRSPGMGITRLVAVGASTGGPEALREMVSGLGVPDCALLLSQHMPERFMAPFAERLSASASLDIRVAGDGEEIVAGRGYVAPGDTHLTVQRRSGRLYCQLDQREPVCGHRPSVDVMFESVAEQVADGALGILMTGMGEDGAAGLLKMHERGSLTIVQDRQSSVVWGMPGRAAAIGAADHEIALASIGPFVARLFT